MPKVTFNMSVSLDGFVAGPNDQVDKVFGWYTGGDTEFAMTGAPFTFKVSTASAEHLKEMTATIGAIVTGKRNFEVAKAWGGNPPLGVHHFVLTHSVPQEWACTGSNFTFVQDGIESAIAQARQRAGDKDVCISSADVMRQALAAELLDEINIDLVPVVLGEGVRLFGPGAEPTNLEVREVIQGAGVTHLRYRVVR